MQVVPEQYCKQHASGLEDVRIFCVAATESIKVPDNVAKQRGGIVSQICCCCFALPCLGPQSQQSQLIDKSTIFKELA